MIRKPILKSLSGCFATIAVAASMFTASSCRSEVDKYMDFLYASMPLGDSLVCDRAYWEANVEKTLQVRDRMKWNVPEREFRHFVLPLRVNNENLDDFRTFYADSLCDRVQGMSMAEAALEVNHWCHERATYIPSDGRTLGPMALINAGLGRCGEESVLAVSALRAAGIPARQVYTPRWAHTDDNHAWVEVFVDGAWHFMGACEPEPVLDMAWFNSSVSRAMLLHTRVFGEYHGPEDVISRTPAYTEINCIRSYIPTRRTSVTVRDTEGNPVSGALVQFKIYNYAEFFTVASYKSDENGRAALDTGCGDIVIWACDGAKFGLGVAGDGENVIVLDKILGEDYTIDLDINPPAEDPLKSNATPEQIQANALRLEAENAIRLARPRHFISDPELFLAAKDSVDVTAEVIDDARCRPLTGNRHIDSPRVELEMLMPVRREIISTFGDSLHSPAEVAQWIEENITIDRSRNPQGLRIPPAAVLKARVCDARSRDILFVAMCRALGFAARLDEATSVPEYAFGSQWISVSFGAQNSAPAPTPKARLHVDYKRAQGSPVRTAEYYRHYTFSKVEDGRCHLCEYDENAPVRFDYDLAAGYYMMVSGTRLASGSVLARVRMFTLEENASVSLPLQLRSADNKVQVLGSIDPECHVMPVSGDTPASQSASILSLTGRGYFLLCIMGKGDEPTVHALGQLRDMAEDINQWGRPVVVLDGAVPEGLNNVIRARDINGSVRAMAASVQEAIRPDSTTKSSKGIELPVIMLADSFGRVVYLSTGYNTSLLTGLQSTIHGL